MRSKTNDFYLMTTSCDYDVIVLTETWLRGDVSNVELSSNYNIFRCDRSSVTSQLQRGGGTLIAVKKSIFGENVQLERSESLEQVVVKVSSPSTSIYVCGIYLRPNSEPSKFVAHSDCVEQIINKAACGDSVVIVGDYNLPHLLWSYDDDVDCYLPTNASTEQELVFVENMISSGLQQICNIRNSNGRLLDLAFVKNCDVELFEAPSSILPTDRHHNPFVLRLTTQSASESLNIIPTDQEFDYDRCDHEAVIEDLRLLNWENIFSGANVNQALAAFYNLLFSIISRHTPLRRPNPRRSNNQPWWNPDLRHRRNVLRKARRRYLRHRTVENMIMLRNLEAEYNACVSSYFREYICRIQDEVKANPSSFWRYFKSRKDAQSIPSKMSFGDSTSQDTESSAELFADYFKTVYNVNHPLNSYELLTFLPSFDIQLPFPTFSEAEVSNALNSVDPSKGPGSDKLPPAFIQRCAQVLGLPVCILFNLSLSEGIFPDAWKVSAVTPIHKAGSTHDVQNYRPISILCCLAKTLELLIHERMYAAAKPIISHSQHGFVKNRSTTTNLMVYVSALNSSLEKRRQVDSIYVDFSKAFDKVPHELALRKLERLGFPHWLIIWLQSYLRERSAYVKLRFAKSARFATPSGVPQGSHLGPLIFVLFVNDLIHHLKSEHLMYADDLKIYRTISTIVDCAALQQDIDAIANWCDVNGMEMNALKCKVLSFSKSPLQFNFNYVANGVSLERVTSIRDLGVIINSKLNFSDHITMTTSKAFAMLGFIRRNAYEFRDVYALKNVYCTIVRSLLEYAVQIWAPYIVTHITRIERVQRCFIRFALRRLPWNDSLRLPPYEQRCQLIKLESLQSRRVLLQRMFAFDIVTNRIDCPDLLQQVCFYVPARRSRPRSLFWITRHRTVFGQNHPLENCLSLLNVAVFDFEISRDIFKTRIRQLL